MLSNLLKFIKLYQSEILLVLGVMLVALTSYNLGRIVAIQETKTPIKIETAAELANILHSSGESGEDKPAAAVKPADQRVFASKKAKSMLYHFSWCPGAGQIAEANKLTFANEAAAIAAGYSLAGNCSK